MWYQPMTCVCILLAFCVFSFSDNRSCGNCLVGHSLNMCSCSCI
ncbi:hypothetical protein GLYMA_10G115850v4 [Glycine max]|nr:hypothetical protein GLYMA_10G115850v4 [Glycine max]